MMRLAALLVAVAVPAMAAGPNKAEQVAQGRTLFTRSCAPCHGTGPGIDGSPALPGTAALEAKYKGERPAALERRDDLPSEVLGYFVRHGTGAMPMFRKTEISDAGIEAIAAYLKDASRRKR